MKLKQLSPLICLFLLFACSKEEIKLPEEIKEIKSRVETKEVTNNRIDFSDPQEGQISYYKRYMKQCDYESFGYTKDTLIVRVLKQGEDFYFEENLTEGSPMKSAGFFEQPFTYKVQSLGDDLLVPQREGTQLFYFYGNDTIRLNPQHDVDLVQNECYVLQEGDNFIGDDIGFIENFKIGEVEENKKTMVSCVPMVLEVEAYLVYDQRQLYISHVIFRDEFFDQTSAAGWELLE